MYSAILFYQYELKNIYFILWLIIQYYCDVFCGSKCSRFGHRSFFQVVSCALLTCPFIIIVISIIHMSTSLLSGTVRCTKLTLYFICSTLYFICSSPSKQPCFFLIKRKWYLETNRALGVLSAAGCLCFSPLQRTELGNIYVYYTDLYFCIFLKVFLNKHFM